MPRSSRSCPGGLVYHVWNRAAGRLRLFKTDADYLAFERIMVEARQRHPLAILDWCLMPNHWHFAVMPESDDQVTRFFRWLTHTHAMRATTHRRVMGMGPLYQGRFKTLPVEADEHLLTLLRYVERNPVRAGLVKKSADWRWGSAGVRRAGPPEMAALLSDWPVERPPRWSSFVDRPQADAEVERIREHVRRSRPFGSADWVRKTVAELGLGSTLRPRGRPAKRKAVAK
jgi:putative transposase